MHCVSRSSLLFLILVPFLISGNQGSITIVREPSPDEYNMRIVGGVDTRPYEFPWMVQVISYVVFPGGGSVGLDCPGTLISDQWVLTTGSCFNINQGPDYIELTLGAYDFTVNSTMEPNRQVFNSTEFYGSIGSFPFPNAAIGLVKLPKPVELSEYIKPISLPRLCDPDRISESVTVTGWGKDVCVNSSCTVLPTPLQMFNDTLVNVRKCNGLEIPLLPIFSIWTSGNDSKKAGPGSPVNYIRPEDGNWAVLGVFSGISYTYPDCVETDYYYSYNRVQSSLKWIYDITGLPDPDANVTECDNPLTTIPLTEPFNSTGPIQSPIALKTMFLIVLCNVIQGIP